MSNPHRLAGFTLVEIMIVVAIISLLGAMAIPSLKHARERAQAVTLAAELRAISDGIEMYWAEHNKPAGISAKWGYSGYPDGMDLYFPKRNDWQTGPVTGGRWLWYYYPNHPWGFDSFLCLYQSQMTSDQITQIDTILDDGNLGTGKVRYIPPYLYCCEN